MQAASDEAYEDTDFTEAAAKLHDETYYDLLETVPTTIEGMAAIVAFMVYASTGELAYVRCEEDEIVFLKTLDQALRRLTGTAS